MYIEPNTTLQLFKNLRLDGDYANTMWFSNISAQNSFFNGRPVADMITLTNHSYQRKDNGVIKVQLAISQAFDLTYMRFINSSFENKWFYAFIDKVEYVNNTTVYIYYTLDLIQTYMFDWTLHECMIERQHSLTDVAGDNLEIESLEIGDAIADGTYVGDEDDRKGSVIFDDITDYTMVLWRAKTSGESAPSRGLYSGLPSGLRFDSFPITEGQGSFLALIEKLDNLADGNQTDTIASIGIIPTNYCSFGDNPISTLHAISKPTTLNGYTPVNKKLLTYPYCYLMEYNDQNESLDFRYELFTNPNYCNFRIYGINSATPELISVPSYDGNSDNIRYAINISGFPQIPYATDSYKAWLAMNYDQIQFNKEIANRELDLNTRENKFALDANNMNLYNNMVGGLSRAVIGGAVGGSIGGATSGASGIANALYDWRVNKEKIGFSQEGAELSNYKTIQSANIQESVAKKIPSTPHSGTNSGTVAIKKKGIYFQRMSIRRQFAEKVDKFFTMFGYAQNKVGVPNIHTRQQFTYVKTAGCSIAGNIPQDDKSVINSIFNNGIRFWTNYANFENYSISNPII